MSPTHRNPNDRDRSSKPDEDAVIEEGSQPVSSEESEDEDQEEGTATVSNDMDEDDDLDLGDESEEDADADTGVEGERESSDGKAGRQPADRGNQEP